MRLNAPFLGQRNLSDADTLLQERVFKADGRSGEGAGNQRASFFCWGRIAANDGHTSWTPGNEQSCSLTLSLNSPWREGLWFSLSNEGWEWVACLSSGARGLSRRPTREYGAVWPRGAHVVCPPGSTSEQEGQPSPPTCQAEQGSLSLEGGERGASGCSESQGRGSGMGDSHMSPGAWEACLVGSRGPGREVPRACGPCSWPSENGSPGSVDMTARSVTSFPPGGSVSIHPPGRGTRLAGSWGSAVQLGGVQ